MMPVTVVTGKCHGAAHDDSGAEQQGFNDARHRGDGKDTRAGAVPASLNVASMMPVTVVTGKDTPGLSAAPMSLPLQ